MAKQKPGLKTTTLGNWLWETACVIAGQLTPQNSRFVFCPSSSSSAFRTSLKMNSTSSVTTARRRRTLFNSLSSCLPFLFILEPLRRSLQGSLPGKPFPTVKLCMMNLVATPHFAYRCRRLTPL